jgi:serine/threonine protein kinase
LLDLYYCSFSYYLYKKNNKGGDWRNVSVQAKDLVRKMLEYNVDQRISAWKAFNHPWI